MNVETGHIILQNGTKNPIGITNYAPGKPHYTTIRGLGGESEKILTGRDSGSISFVVNPHFAPDTGEVAIELPDGKIIKAFITNVNHRVESGRGIVFCTGITN